MDVTPPRAGWSSIRFSPKLPLIAAVTAFLLAAIGLLSALHQLILIVFSLVPLCAGIGIIRKQVWSAYGFALFELSQLLVLAILLLRGGSIPRPQVAFTVALNIVIALLFFQAGRSLAESGSPRGAVYPWIAVCCLLTLPLLFVGAFIVPSGGMEDTLLIGDRIVAQVFPRFTLTRGDIVIFHYPIDRRQTFLKRVIGIPGDRIRIASQVVYRNGVALKESYAVHKFNLPDSYGNNCPNNRVVHPPRLDSAQMRALDDMLQHHVINGEVVVPAGKYFVLGDNRDNSLDSRYWGFLELSDVFGKPILIYDSEEPSIDQPGGAKTLSRNRIRWNRLFKLL